MIKSSKYMKFAGMAISALFTVLLFQLFAETPLERGIYLGAAIVVEYCKITLVMHSLKRGKAFIITCFMAFLFFAISLTASISFNMYTAQKAMYETIEIIHTDTRYSNTYSLLESQHSLVQSQIEEIRGIIATVEAERAGELARMNSVIAETPADFVTLRRELTGDRAAILEGYDSQIDDLRSRLQVETAVLTGIMVEMSEVPEREVVETITEERQLRDNSLAGFFVLMSDLTGAEVYSIILLFAVLLGIALDLTGISFVLVENANTAAETMLDTVDTAKSTALEVIETVVETDVDKPSTLSMVQSTAKIICLKKIDCYENFEEYVIANNLDAETLTPSNFPNVPRSTFYKYKKNLHKSTVGTEAARLRH